MLVNCVVYERGERVADIPVSEIRSHLTRPGCFVWVALKDPEPSELQGLQEEFGLHELAVEDAQQGHQRPKIEEYGSSLFVVLQMVEWPGGDELETGEVSVFIGPHTRSRCAAERSTASPRCGSAASRSRSCCGTGRPTSSTR